MRPGGVVIERTLAEALGVGVGDRITLDGRPFTVAGIAVTAAAAPYPNCQDTDCLFTMNTSSNLSTLNVGLTWVTEADARALVSPQAPLSYILNLNLKDPATAPTLANQVLSADGGGVLTIPPVWWLAAVGLAILAAVAVMASIPALVGARIPAAQILQSETA